MALLDLSLVTRTLTTLLDRRLPQFPDWPNATPLTVSPGAPDLVNGDFALSFYLYHAQEDAHTKAQDWQNSEPIPQRYKPMGVTLNYVLCPRSNVADVGTRALNDQLVFGLALRTFHDYPFIEDQTVVDDGMGGLVQVMPVGLRGRANRLRISLRPTPVEDAGHYWQSGNLSLRLAAYYEVCAVLLEPELPRSRAGRVLSVNIPTFVGTPPVIQGTRSEISFTMPGDPASRVLDASPAQTAYDDQLLVFGSGLKGDRTELYISHPDFVQPMPADAAWNLASDGNQLRVDVQPAASGQTLLPGIYAVSVRTIAQRRLADGTQRDFPSDSNVAVFAISPAILNVAFAAGLGTLTLDRFDPTTLTGNELLLFVGSASLIRVNVAPVAGQFRALAGPFRLEFRLPVGTPAGLDLPIRVVVRGAESAPRWEVTP